MFVKRVKQYSFIAILHSFLQHVLYLGRDSSLESVTVLVETQNKLPDLRNSITQTYLTIFRVFSHLVSLHQDYVKMHSNCVQWRILIRFFRRKRKKLKEEQMVLLSVTGFKEPIKDFGKKNISPRSFIAAASTLIIIHLIMR